ncbi:MAG: Type II secretion system protein J precursor [Alphaproteobacteria bacterium ADurb.BinA280]|jgi:general secretion pathway protein J|nr:MAG: Type II secretion system protein J precursor [Alphaproteobacteria bacterium ADurb.BinA280]
MICARASASLCGARARMVGFTLLEVVVAVGLFAVVSALAFGGLSSLLRSREQLASAAADLADMQLAMQIFERDVRSALLRPVRDSYGEVLPSMAGDADSLELTRSGYSNGLQLARSELERVAWRQQKDAWQRGRWAVLDRAPTTSVDVADVLTGVTRMQLRYRTRDGQETDRWPLPGREDQLPLALELRLQTRSLGEIRRLIEISPGGWQ